METRSICCVCQQFKVSRQDDTPVMGTKSQVVLHTTVTYELPEPSTTPKYYYGPQTKTYNIADQTFTVPDSGIVPIQVDIPDNATQISLRVSNITCFKSFIQIFQF